MSMISAAWKVSSSRCRVLIQPSYAQWITLVMDRAMATRRRW